MSKIGIVKKSYISLLRNVEASASKTSKSGKKTVASGK